MSVTTILRINSLHSSDNYGIGRSRDKGYGTVCRSTGKDTFGAAERDTYGTGERETFGK